MVDRERHPRARGRVDAAAREEQRQEQASRHWKLTVSGSVPVLGRERK